MPLKYHGHRGRGTVTARPKYGLKHTRGCRILFFYFEDSTLWTTCSAIRLPHKRCKIQGSRQSYAALWNSQVVSIMSGISVSNTIPRPAPGQDMLNNLISFCLSHYLYHSALINSLFINNA